MTTTSSAQAQHTITIRVEGGVIQEVEDVPPGVVVRVVDYDNDTMEDDAGSPCSIALHDGGPDEEKAEVLAALESIMWALDEAGVECLGKGQARAVLAKAKGAQ